MSQHEDRDVSLGSPRLASLYVVHLLASTLLTGAAAAWLAVLIYLITYLLSHNSGQGFLRFYFVHLFALNVIAGLLIGYIFNYQRRRLPSWVWIIPMVSLTIAIFLWHPPSVLGDSFSHTVVYFFGPTCYPLSFRDLFLTSIPCFDQLRLTVPFYCAVSYSLGALAARHSLLTALFSVSRENSERS